MLIWVSPLPRTNSEGRTCGKTGLAGWVRLTCQRAGQLFGMSVYLGRGHKTTLDQCVTLLLLDQIYLKRSNVKEEGFTVSQVERALPAPTERV